MKKKICILGSTGSIGCSTLELISENKDKYEIETLTANTSVEKLAKQAIKYQAKNVVIADQNKYKELKNMLSGFDIKIFAGEEELINISNLKYDVCIVGIMGMVAIKPIMSAIDNSKVLGLANKESIVCAGEFILKKSQKCDTKIIPLDSEHNAIFQVFEEENRGNIEKVVLTASGGPFIHKNTYELENITPEEAIKHPNWKMGAKISVDSATMANKGLEVIEACKLFDLDIDKVDAIIHPESIIHGMVYYSDGTILSQMAYHDMKTPISYSLDYPKRMKFNHKVLDFTRIQRLNFTNIDKNKFPLFYMAKEAYSLGNYATIAYNLANEIAVQDFLKRKIGFLDIYKLVEKVMKNCVSSTINSIGEVFSYSDEIEKKIQKYLKYAN